MEKEKIWYELLKTYQNNVNVVTFTTLLCKIYKRDKYFCDGCFSTKYANKTAKDY